MIPISDRAFIITFAELKRWDPGSFHAIIWHWPQSVMKPIGSVLRLRKEKVDRSKVDYAGLQPITIHFDGSVDRRQVSPGREYRMDLFFAEPGDIVVAKIDLKNGAVGIVPQDLRNVVITSHFAAYEPDRSRLLPEYLHSVIQTAFFKSHLWRNKVGAEGRKEVKLDFFESVEIPMPPLPVQRAIVSYWERARREAGTLQERADCLEQLLPLRLYEALGTPPPVLDAPTAKWLVLPWKDLERWSFGYVARARHGLLGFTTSRYPVEPLSKHLHGTMNGYCIRPVATPTPHRMLKLNALTPAGLDLSASKFVPVSDEIANRFELREGDLLICRSVGSYDQVAKCALVDADAPGFLFPDIMIRARFRNSLLPGYAREVLQSPLGRSYFKSNARTSVGMWKIGAADIRNFPIPVPPLEVQAGIVERIREGRAEIAADRDRAERLLTDAKANVEAMILGTMSVPLPDAQP